MPFGWDDNWDGTDNGHQNNNDATKSEIIAILKTAESMGRGDQGLLEALTAESDEVTISKGIHQDTVNTNPHITVSYRGGTWHINLKGTAQGGRAGYRVGAVEQWRQ